MKPGDLVLIDLHERVAGLLPYSSFNRCVGITLGITDIPHVLTCWDVLVNGEIRPIRQEFLRLIDESQGRL